MKKPFILITVIAAAIMASIMIIHVINEVEKNAIPDTNGAENFALATITMEQIVNKELGSYQKWTGCKGTGEQTNVRDNRKEYDYTQMSAHAKSFSGVGDLQVTITEHNVLTLDIESTVTSGNYAIIILIDGELHSEVPINQRTQITLTDVANKTVIVRMAGESAEYAVVVTRSMND